ncbi:hypothetical protein GCM10028820_01690 [Tessaracoccus terricola]
MGSSRLNGLVSTPNSESTPEISVMPTASTRAAPTKLTSHVRSRDGEFRFFTATTLQDALAAVKDYSWEGTKVP